MSTAMLRSLPPSADFRVLAPPLDPRTQDQPVPQDTASTAGVVVTGDNHLSAHVSRLPPPRRAERRQRLRSGFAAAVTFAIEHGARLFVQAGDLFDTPSPGNEDRAFVAQQLARLQRAGIVSVGIGGNHDTPRMVTEQGGEAPQGVYAALAGLHYFPRHDTLVPRLFTFGNLRVAVAGLSNNPVAPPGSDPLAHVSIADPEDVLSQAHIALLILHAGIEGLCRPEEGERIVRRARIAALPPVFRVVAAGHIHRFARERMGERGLVVCGATERMEFGSAAGGAGFAWLEIDRSGLRRAEHIRVPEQPRADLTVSTDRLWPRRQDAHMPALPDSLELPAGTDVASESLAELTAFGGSAADTLWQAGANGREDTTPLAVLRRLLAEVCTPETMVRLRLTGPLSLDQYHQLPLREILAYGQQRAFSLDVDTAGLRLLEPATVQRHTGGGPISPANEVRALLEERLRTRGERDPDEVTLRAAADLLLSRFQAATDAEAGR